ncbi:RagB/SusD family nutrient uptake outer membrane protein [Flavilitoribacter nigricans]|uniref:RagB/SusD family nutrient uptake outer membrane protein n=1 Tax=Flavilitoribacter nigricans (strain ATCC 23147 / DSM 23189 / NBRC 102662 / NCIMB 1420 / SS-2) TaxID=1122177 RepID=A0A2D0N9T6_FLAN2|nr:RagB/SusD family nutrient uptake outer membrane protein [Flavilitoribacter nigricans]PHN05284.1 RagB/SusD family nutrient uptake outer membrane protein [Flavilitoribacter nigricans DSM 23189 = NBRC 102662]
MRSIKIIFTLAVFMGALSCSDDFLTKAPQAQFSTVALETPEGVEGILLGAYAMVDGTGLNGQAPWENDIHNWVFGGIASDNALKGTDAGDQPEQSFIEAYDFNSFNNHIRNKWRGLYKGVARTNDAINSAEAVEALGEDRRRQIIAEARFLRGLFHFEAQKMWKFPVYIDNTVYDINNVESTKIPNDGKIWDQIEADFEAAAAVLPETQSEVGRPTSYAAKAFLAKAKMYQGWDENGNANLSKLQEAKPLLEDIINSNKYSLVSKFSDNFLVRTNNNAESIWEVQFTVSSATGDNANQGVGLAHPYIAPWGCCGFYQASQNLVNAFKTDANGLPLPDSYNDENVTWETEYTGPLDPRLDHTVGRPGILYKNFQIHGTDFIRDLSYAGPYSSMKHVAEPEVFGINGWGNLSANGYRIMRYGMVLLWLAEVEVELGNLDRAQELVNLIRARAANAEDFVPKATQGADSRQSFTVLSEPAANYTISEYTAPWTDQDMARKAVRFESRLEFAMEGHRFFDLQRWGIQAEVLNDYLQSESRYRVYLQGKTFVEGKNEFYPIPTEAIDRSYIDGQPTLTQDPSYN